MNNFSFLLEKSKMKKEKSTPIIVYAHEENILKSIYRCIKESIVNTPILIGDEKKIKEILKLEKIDISNFKIINILDKIEASERAIELIINNEGNFLIKGLVDTSIILKAILNKKEDLKRDKEIFLSHVSVIKNEKIDRLFLISDAAMNISPSVNDKIKIIENTLIVSKALDMVKPKIALIAAKEKVSERMIATVDAKKVEEYYKDKDIIVEGPLALDNAISQEAAKIKGLDGKIKGDASILIMPNIESGNILYKSLTYFCKSEIAGVLIGAKVPIVITSRADEEENKFLSIVLATLI